MSSTAMWRLNINTHGCRTHGIMVAKYIHTQQKDTVDHTRSSCSSSICRNSEAYQGHQEWADKHPSTDPHLAALGQIAGLPSIPTPLNPVPP